MAQAVLEVPVDLVDQGVIHHGAQKAQMEADEVVPEVLEVQVEIHAIQTVQEVIQMVQAVREVPGVLVDQAAVHHGTLRVQIAEDRVVLEVLEAQVEIHAIKTV